MEIRTDIYIYTKGNFLRYNSIYSVCLFSSIREKRRATMSRRSWLRRLGATKLYLNSRSWDGAAHGIGQWSMEEHPVRSHRWPHRLLPFLFIPFEAANFRQTRLLFSYLLQLPCHATFHRPTRFPTARFYYPPSSLPPPRTGVRNNTWRYNSMNRDRSFAIVPSVSPVAPRR